MLAPADGPIQPLAYNVKQVAEALGVGESLLRTLVAQRQIPFTRLGDRIVFPVAPLQDWLASEAARSKAEPFEVTGR